MDQKQFAEQFPEAVEIGHDVTPGEFVAYFDDGKEVRAWRENRRTTTGEWEFLSSDDAAAARQRYPRQNPAQSQDHGSGLVERGWVRTSRKGGKTTERTLEGEEVTASFLDRQGHLQRAAGRVIRNDAGELVIESRADGVRQETAVTRDANVDAKGTAR